MLAASVSFQLKASATDKFKDTLPSLDLTSMLTRKSKFTFFQGCCCVTTELRLAVKYHLQFVIAAVSLCKHKVFCSFISLASDTNCYFVFPSAGSAH